MPYGTGPAAGPADPSQTPLELEIAKLAAAGLTNKQIGERLHLSHRTVAAHLYRIFPRLGVTSRAALRDALDRLEGPPREQSPAAGWRVRCPSSTLSSPQPERRSTMTEDRLENEADVVTKLSHLSVADTVAKLTGMISAKGMKVFAVIDQSAEARQVGLSLRETTLVLFGSPKAGTPVMVASPLAALDLPLKVLVWADGEQTKVSYYAPAALAASHHLSADLAGNLAGINALTDALVAS